MLLQAKINDMNKALNNIVNNLKLEGLEYSDFSTLLSRIYESKEKISKDDILDLVTNDYRIHLNTKINGD